MRIMNSTNIVSKDIVSKEKLQASLELIPRRLKEVQLAVERATQAYSAEQERRKLKLVEAAVVVEEEPRIETALPEDSSVLPSGEGQLDPGRIRESIASLYGEGL